MANNEASDSKPQKKEKKQTNPNFVIPPKKPKLSKAERRALQEKQRAEKEAAGGSKPNKHQSSKQPTKQPSQSTTTKSTNSNESSSSSVDKTNNVSEQKRSKSKTIELFSHLPQYKAAQLYPCGVTLESMADNITGSGGSKGLHPSTLELGIKYRDGTVRGANARCKAMMEAFKHVIRDYQLPLGKHLTQDLDTIVKTHFQHLTSCRLHSISMGNAVTFLKIAIANLSRDAQTETAKEMLCDQIDAYVQERITFAGEVICDYAMSKIQNGDVILVYGRSEVVQTLLLRANKNKDLSFRVIVVDSRPLMEGRALLETLCEHGMDCTYIFLNAVSYVMKEVTKVFLGAAALMSNGAVLSRVGTAGISLMAHSCNVPVLICCETYKISNRVQLESITGNELGNPLDVACVPGGDGHNEEDWWNTPNLNLLNLLYDLTPSEYVSGIVTELGILPPTSVAVIIREMNPQDNNEAYRGM